MHRYIGKGYVIKHTYSHIGSVHAVTWGTVDLFYKLEMHYLNIMIKNIVVVWLGVMV